MFSHGYIENDFDVDEWAAPEFLEQAAMEAARGRVETAPHGKTSEEAGSRRKAHGSDREPLHILLVPIT